MYKISLLIPVFNGAEHLQNLLLSLRKQEYQNIEILFLNDNSSDDTGIMLQNFLHNSPLEVKVFTSYKQRGFYRNLKILIRLAKGQFYMVVGHDDFLSNNFLSQLANSNGFKSNKDIITFKSHSFNLQSNSVTNTFSLKKKNLNSREFLRYFHKLELGNIYIGLLNINSFGLRSYFAIEKLGHMKFANFFHEGFLNDHRILTYFFSKNRSGLIYYEDSAVFYKGYKPLDINLNVHDGRALNVIDYNLAILIGIVSTLNFSFVYLLIWLRLYVNLIRCSLGFIIRGRSFLSFSLALSNLAIGLRYIIPGKR